MVTQEQEQKNREFNQLVAKLPTKTVFVGQWEDGTPVTVEVHTLGDPQ